MMKKYIDAGYTHWVSWEEWNKVLQMFVEKSFPATEDAVESYHKNLLDKLKQNPGVMRNVTIKLLKDM